MRTTCTELPRSNVLDIANLRQVVAVLEAWNGLREPGLFPAGVGDEAWTLTPMILLDRTCSNNILFCTRVQRTSGMTLAWHFPSLL